MRISDDKNQFREQFIQGDLQHVYRNVNLLIYSIKFVMRQLELKADKDMVIYLVWLLAF